MKGRRWPRSRNSVFQEIIGQTLQTLLPKLAVRSQLHVYSSKSAWEAIKTKKFKVIHMLCVGSAWTISKSISSGYSHFVIVKVIFWLATLLFGQIFSKSVTMVLKSFFSSYESTAYNRWVTNAYHN